MNKFFTTRRAMPSFDAKAVSATIQRALSSAGIDTSSGTMHTVTETIRRALASAGPAAARPTPSMDESVIDVSARVVPGEAEPSGPSTSEAPAPRGPAAATFETLQFSNHAGTRPYRLYTPAVGGNEPRPVVVMLHGCTQSAEDFAAGTRMNQLADVHDFIVVYPEQTAQANPSRCWNWFNTGDQRRDTGEPALIAGLVRDVAARHCVDPRRIYVAGLSAGAAMAVILGETYPELFAAVGVHSGLPYGSAHDVASAMAAMKGGRSGLPGLKGLPEAASPPARGAGQAVPTIVFHGDRDHTVQHSNGARIVGQAKQAHRAQAQQAALDTSMQQGATPDGRRYTRAVHTDATGRAHIEHWTLHGAGHAWSGGSASGSYTDAAGPDASAEMLRFFLAQPRAGSA